MRKLATAALAFSAAVFLARYLLPIAAVAYVTAGLILLGAAALFLKVDKGLRLRLVCFGAAVGLLVSGLSYMLRDLPSRELSGETRTFEAEVCEFPQVTEAYTSLTLKLRDEGLPSVKAVTYVYGQELPELAPGDRVRLTAKFRYSGQRYGEDWAGYGSDGVYLRCYIQGEPTLVGRSPLSFMYFPKHIEKAVGKSLSQVCGEDSVGFMTALLTGDKSLLYEDTGLYSSMSKAGVLHVVAISGMHVAFLVGFLRLVLRKKKTSSAVGIPLVWIFAAMAGATPSVVRAAFMHSAFLAAYLVNRENDGLTSMSAILALLLLINPAACASVSLQLSFSAVLGMLFITPRIYQGMTRPLNRRRKRGRAKESLPKRSVYGLLYAVIASFAATLGAIALSTPISAVYFGAVPTWSILSNILIFWAVSACFVLGYAAVFLGMIFLPAGRLLGFAVDVLSAYVAKAVGLVGELPYSRLYVNEGYFFFWLIAVYAIFIAWAVFRRGKSFRPVIPVCLVLSLLCVGVVSSEIRALNAPAAFTAADVGQGQSLILSDEGRAIVVDCGGVNTVKNPGDIVASLLVSRGIDTVDALCLSHFDQDHINGVITLMYMVDVKSLVIPPEGQADTHRDKLLTEAEKRGVEVYIINEDTEILLKDIRLTVFRPISRTSPELMFHADVAGSGVLITGDADIEAEKRLLLSRELPGVDIIVAGHHGSKHSCGSELLEAVSAKTAVISCGWNNYGHPSEEVLTRLAEENIEVLRTDILGTVDIIIER